MIGVFIGENGSCGFKYNREYKLTSKVIDKYIWLESKEGFRCPYSSVENILRNWKIYK